ncbi:hypothetical protein [Bacteroides caecigallinarum]|uniref:hypothetical protein n=1 Tax=Bacteroides caecigallinarum TaxID=1411144 RepID=UPI0019567FB7|nr:hypothetical protein [Bacteroides caecigallinarum]MBM6884068.1 hypothetical protein [Bacteroides caecigallinarum]
MKTIKNNQKMTILGSVFYGVEDIINHALSGRPQNGVYVGYDSERYPCFDSEDFIYERRQYWNFVFAVSLDDLAVKLEKLKNMKQLGYNFNKLTQELHPMAYWQGDSNNPILLTDEND